METRGSRRLVLIQILTHSRTRTRTGLRTQCGTIMHGAATGSSACTGSGGHPWRYTQRRVYFAPPAQQLSFGLTVCFSPVSSLELAVFTVRCHGNDCGLLTRQTSSSSTVSQGSPTAAAGCRPSPWRPADSRSSPAQADEPGGWGLGKARAIMVLGRKPGTIFLGGCKPLRL